MDAVGKYRCCRLTDNAQYLKACLLPCLHGCLAPEMVEIRRYGNHGFVNILANLILRLADKPLQQLC